MRLCRNSPRVPGRSRSGLLRGGIAAVMLLSACSVDVGTIGLELASRTVFDVNWNRFSRLPDSKAFALAGNPDGRNAIGLVYGMSSTDEARAKALDYCEEERKARAIDGPCTILAIDDVVLGDASGPVAKRSESVRSSS